MNNNELNDYKIEVENSLKKEFQYTGAYHYLKKFMVFCSKVLKEVKEELGETLPEGVKDLLAVLSLLPMVFGIPLFLGFIIPFGGFYMVAGFAEVPFVYYSIIVGTSISSFIVTVLFICIFDLVVIKFVEAFKRAFK